MSEPNEDQIRTALSRARVMLTEWTDAEYFLAARDEEGVWRFEGRLDLAGHLQIARALISLVIDEDSEEV